MKGVHLPDNGAEVKFDGVHLPNGAEVKAKGVHLPDNGAEVVIDTNPVGACKRRVPTNGDRTAGGGLSATPAIAGSAQKRRRQNTIPIPTLQVVHNRSQLMPNRLFNPRTWSCSMKMAWSRAVRRSSLSARMEPSASTTESFPRTNHDRAAGNKKDF